MTERRQPVDSVELGQNPPHPELPHTMQDVAAAMKLGCEVKELDTIPGEFISLFDDLFYEAE